MSWRRRTPYRCWAQAPFLFLLPPRAAECWRDMKVGVVSDTHLPRFGDRLPPGLRRGLGEQGVELILHLGDFTGPRVPSLFEALAPLEAVAGNNDPPALVRRFGRRKVVTLAGVRVGLVHGDGTRGTTTSRSLSAFGDDEVDVICFGHSHRPVCERRGEIWLVNPGSPTDKRTQARYSYAVLDIRGAHVEPRLVFFDRDGIEPRDRTPPARGARAAQP